MLVIDLTDDHQDAASKCDEDDDADTIVYEHDFDGFQDCGLIRVDQIQLQDSDNKLFSMETQQNVVDNKFILPSNDIKLSEPLALSSNYSQMADPNAHAFNYTKVTSVPPLLTKPVELPPAIENHVAVGSAIEEHHMIRKKRRLAPRSHDPWKTFTSTRVTAPVPAEDDQKLPADPAKDSFSCVGMDSVSTASFGAVKLTHLKEYDNFIYQQQESDEEICSSRPVRVKGVTTQAKRRSSACNPEKRIMNNTELIDLTLDGCPDTRVLGSDVSPESKTFRERFNFLDKLVDGLYGPEHLEKLLGSPLPQSKQIIANVEAKNWLQNISLNRRRQCRTPA